MRERIPVVVMGAVLGGAFAPVVSWGLGALGAPLYVRWAGLVGVCFALGIVVTRLFRA